MAYVSVYFRDKPGEPLEAAARHIFRDHDGRVVNSGTTLAGPGAGQRDLEAIIPAERVDECYVALRQAGFTKIAVR